MSHAHSVIDLAEGLTVLVGPNNCGKSAIVTALQTVCHYESSKFMLRHGERECLVRLETFEGDVVEWSRTKSGAPMYKINGEQFDRLNRKVPHQLHDVLKMPLVDCDDEVDVHFGEQKQPTFLLNDRAATAAQFFASTSDTKHLLSMQQIHRQQIAERKKDLNRLGEEHGRLEAELEQLAPLEQLRAQLLTSEESYAQLQAEGHQLQLMNQLIRKLEACENRVQRLYGEANALTRLETVPTMQPVQELEDFIVKLAASISAEQFARSQSSCLSELPLPPDLAPASGLESLLLHLERIQRKRDTLLAAAELFDRLVPPPEIEEAAELQKVIETFCVLNQRRVTCQRQFDALGRLNPPPLLLSDERMASLLGQLQEMGIRLEEKQSESNQISELLAVVNQRMDEWAAENPVCPTCGQPTSLEHGLTKGGNYE